MKKTLVITHIGRHLRLFSRADAEILHAMGTEVHFAANFRYAERDTAPPDIGEKYVLHQVDFSRSPLFPEKCEGALPADTAYEG